MPFCKNCGTELREKARFCDNCGTQVVSKAPSTKINQQAAPNKSRLGWLFLVTGIIIVIFIINLQNESNRTSQKSYTTKSVDTRSNSSSVFREKKYAHNTINVRSGRSTNSEIVGTLNRGDEVEIDSLKNGWAVVYRNGRRLGYVYENLLKETSIPRFEIVSWNWYTDPSFGSDGSVIWNVQVRNNTTKYVSSLKVEFTTYDAAGNIIETDYTFVSGLSPGGTSSAKSYATYFGGEKKAGIRIDPSSIY